MLTAVDNAEILRNKIKEGLAVIDIEELRHLYGMIAAIAAEKAIKFANRDWEDMGLSREKVEREVKKYRQENK